MSLTDRNTILIAEFEHIHGWRMEYLKTLLQTVVLYLALTGFAIDYVIELPEGDDLLFCVGIFDILVGILGGLVIGFAWKIAVQKSKRLKEICQELNIYYEGDSLCFVSPIVIYISYMFVVVVWVLLFSR